MGDPENFGRHQITLFILEGAVIVIAIFWLDHYRGIKVLAVTISVASVHVF